MDAEIEDWTSPKLEVIEDRLMQHYNEFQVDALAWNREWQRGINRRAMARKRAHERAQQDAASADTKAAWVNG